MLSSIAARHGRRSPDATFGKARTDFDADHSAKWHDHINFSIIGMPHHKHAAAALRQRALRFHS
jgi:hypothetical protein